MAQILVDTSAVYALMDRDDAFHRKAVAILRAMPRKGQTPVLTNFVTAECHALLLCRLGASFARRWLLDQAWQIETVSKGDEAVAKDIIRRYTDKEFSYTDATSFAVMERMGIAAAFGCDAHFKQYGFQLLS